MTEGTATITSALEASRQRLDLASPREIAGLSHLELVARHIVEGFLIGLHDSPKRGFSAEFAEDRPYNRGDDLRYLDWKAYARTDRMFIKQYEEETNLRAYLLVDVSGSMGWVSDPERFPTKLAYAQLLAASLSLLLVQQGDATGLMAFDEVLRAHVAPRTTRRHWRRLLAELTHLSANGKTDAGSALKELTGRLQRRGLVVLISDLLVDPDTTRMALRYLRHRGHEVILFHVMDPGELELPAEGEAIFFDPETGEELGANSAALRRQYREAVQAAIDGWRKEALRWRADYALLTTDTPLGLALRQFLRRRSRSS
ncbi:DUF58 domain-containing protein [Candidatus Palauibacter sp.]|uniref:DUF58 domain-containing protein n=1 Tax=Candidatus Palauibacter sp. TaxID=3101350 RepID=UPI003AF2D8C1